MNVNVPNLVKSAVPESEGRNARIISQNTSSHRDPGFLSSDFPRSSPKLYLTSASDDFDGLTLAEWRDEGFEVEFIPLGNSKEQYVNRLRQLSKEDMGPGDTFGIVAYDDAAALCLEHYHVMDNNPEFKLGLLIAYYPSSIPDPKGRFPNNITTLVHLATGEEIGVTKQTQMVGIQGKRRTTRKKVERGQGTGGSLSLAYPSYTYDAESGFAEHDMEEYDTVCAELAWSRSLATARKAFALDAKLEPELEKNAHGKFFSHSLKQALSTYTTHKTPHVTYVSTLKGGIGAEELEKFYSEAFLNPPSMKMTLVSRTIGADHVVDEMHARFKHTQEMPWILPGIPATDKNVEVMIVSVVAMRASKLYHERVYWDQASVLVQVGLLDPKLLPDAAQKLGVKKLPVVGRAAARKILAGLGDDEE